jgi:hypothetical protein
LHCSYFGKIMVGEPNSTIVPERDLVVVFSLGLIDFGPLAEIGFCISYTSSYMVGFSPKKPRSERPTAHIGDSVTVAVCIVGRESRV